MITKVVLYCKCEIVKHSKGITVYQCEQHYKNGRALSVSQVKKIWDNLYMKIIHKIWDDDPIYFVSFEPLNNKALEINELVEIFTKPLSDSGKIFYVKEE